MAADTSGDEDDEEVMVKIQEKERRWAKCHLSRLRCKTGTRIGGEMDTQTPMGNTTTPMLIM